MQFFSHLNAAFLKLLAFRILIVLAYQIMAIVVGWHLYELTHDTLALGLIGLAEAIPYFCCALFAGYAVDHHSRRLFGVGACLMLFLNALVLVAVAAGWIDSNPSVWIYVAIAFTGAARAFIGPSYNAMFALILPRAQYARASGIGSSVFQFGLVVGPALGGLLVGWAGKTAAYSMSTGLCLGAAVALLSLRVEEPPPAASAPLFTSIAEGLRFVFSNQIIFGAQSLDMFAVLFGGAISMLPAFIHDIFHYGPEGLGILRAAPAIGAVTTGLLLTRHPISRHAGCWLLSAVAGFGFCMICFALSTNFWIAGLLLMLSGVFDGVSVVMRTTILQLATPDVMRGRVSAINGLFIGSSNELGAFESGIMARLMGLVPSVVFGGMMTLAVVGATAKLAPKLRRLELHQLH
ncbi:Major facilitator superfamily MFS_1 [Candidatus Methylobacter favarea]|uniref:Major facilitator superfamily MFS_1 n=1 Tax=Candidatus Methylobacter favarea TaxID=2707345 RepID=A0A8S0XHS3_9GAMM|nr:MFS transporter [Candidatus Methylobacter favarea]CAA9889983.1 Major facilitator superfamily MFS_1 [Candidatus Methylobacter favarea]